MVQCRLMLCVCAVDNVLPQDTKQVGQCGQRLLRICVEVLAADCKQQPRSRATITGCTSTCHVRTALHIRTSSPCGNVQNRRSAPGELYGGRTLSNQQPDHLHPPACYLVKDLPSDQWGWL